jgi:hypothetical protein
MSIKDDGFEESSSGLLGRGIYLTSSYDKVSSRSSSLEGVSAG